MPIMYVMKFNNLDDAIEMNNSVPQGLSSSLFTTNQVWLAACSDSRVHYSFAHSTMCCVVLWCVRIVPCARVLDLTLTNPTLPHSH